MKQSLITVLFLGLTVLSFAQDKHFSQFYTAPLTLNPAMSGLFEGRYKGSINYRTQWASILENAPFTTTGAAVEGNFRLSDRGKYPDKLGVGVAFFSDKVGSQSFSTDQISLSGAFHKALDFDGRQVISAGYQISIVQRSINFNQLTFHDQFNGLDGYTRTSQENLPTNNITYGDMSAGIFWSSTINDKVASYLGAGISHFNYPDASFYDNPNIQPDKIFLKTTLQAGARIKFSKQLDLEPRLIVLLQGPHTEIDGGATVRMALDDYASQNLYLGLWFRGVNDVGGSMTMDAVIPMVAYRYENVQVGVSYDVNTSTLSSSTAGRGGFELSMSFIGFYENDNILCPQF